MNVTVKLLEIRSWFGSLIRTVVLIRETGEKVNELIMEQRAMNQRQRVMDDRIEEMHAMLLTICSNYRNRA